MASGQNPIIEILSWAGFAFAAILGGIIQLMDAGLTKLFDAVDNKNLRGD